MYRRVAGAIREVDKNHLVFIETHLTCNTGARSGVEPITNAEGERDPRQAFAPHGYDMVTDTPDVALASDERVSFIFGRHGETAARLGMPMLIGEWGAYYGSAEVLPAARHVVRQFEKLLCSDTYWSFRPDIGESAYFEVLSRPYPVAVAGEIVRYHADPATRRFECVWRRRPGRVRRVVSTCRRGGTRRATRARCRPKDRRTRRCRRARARRACTCRCRRRAARRRSSGPSWPWARGKGRRNRTHGTDGTHGSRGETLRSKERP